MTSILLFTVNWTSVLTGAITFFVVLIIKILLDFQLAHRWVKWFHWLPVRNFFRTKPISLAGKWEETWYLEDTKNFKKAKKRHSHPVIKQLGHYCYSEFIADGITYGVFGTIKNDYFIGEWYDLKDRLGYFGAFQLQINSNKKMNGKWVGHSKSNHEVREGDWEWNRIE